VKAVIYLLSGLVLVLCYVIAVRISRMSRRKRLARMQFPDAWKSILVANVPLYGRLPDKLKDELHGLINVFLTEKRFEGCGGIIITDEMRVTIAALACVLLLNRRTGCYPRLRSVLVYPHPYVGEDSTSIGNTAVQEWSFRAGESWSTGAVVIAWDQVNRRARDVGDGHNVVLHEFAHQLDEEDGTGTMGLPILEKGSSYVTWARILGGEFRELREKVDRDEEDVIDEYGATDEAEFFAVATEAFFENPLGLKRAHPALYRQLQDYYRMYPSEWLVKSPPS
jgi:Mlc titration factor MtfA (ptsG expression regulator)